MPFDAHPTNLDSPANSITPVTVPWEQRLAELRAFKDEHGHTRVPKTGMGPLSRWINTQRINFRRGRISAARKEALDALGFTWGGNQSAWDHRLNKFREFLAEHGQGDVAFIKKFDKALAIWVNRQKGMLTRCELSPEQAAQLLALQVAPAVAVQRRAAADVKQHRANTLAELTEFYKLHGHTQMPPTTDRDSLYYRAMKLRHLAAKMNDEQLRVKLVRLGSYARYPTSGWEVGFSRWKEYVRATGDYACENAAPQHLEEWCARVRRFLPKNGDTLRLPFSQRHSYRVTYTDEVRSIRAAAARLLAAGFVESPTSLTEAQLVAAKVMQLCGLPLAPRLPLHAVLRVLTQRTERGMLAPGVAEKVQKLGLVWQTSRRSWKYGTDGGRLGGALVETRVAPREAAHLSGRKHRTKPSHLKPAEVKKSTVAFRARGHATVVLWTKPVAVSAPRAFPEFVPDLGEWPPLCGQLPQ